MGYLEFKKYAAITGYQNPLQQASFKPRPVGPVESVNVANQNRSTQWQKDAPLLTAQTAVDKQFRQQNTKPEARAYAMFGAAPNKQQASTQPQQQDQQVTAVAQPQPAATTTNQQHTTNQATNKPQPTGNQTIPANLSSIRDTLSSLPQPVQQGIEDALNDIKPGNNVLEMGKLSPDLFSSDEFRNLKTNEERYEYLQRAATKAGVFAAMYQKDENGKVKVTSISDLMQHPEKLQDLPQQVFDQPEFFDSLEKAVENGDMDTLEFLQWAKNQHAKSSAASAGASGAANVAGGKDSPFSIKMSDEQEARLTKAAAKVMWNNVKKDPINNIPRAAGLFLRQQGLDGLADFASNPFSFFLSLAGILLSGGMLLSGAFGGGNQQQPIVINNGPQADTRMQRVPYGI